MSTVASNNPPLDGPPDDPVYLHARRELIVVLLLFFLFAAWAVGVSWIDGYQAAGAAVEEPPLVLGMPRWVFWGILAPWLAVDAVTLWFCLAFMKDDDLGESHEGEDLADQRKRRAARKGESE